jgi:hypothetical protein
MDWKRDDDFLAGLFQAWSRESEEPDLNRIAALERQEALPDSEEDREGILSLEPQMGRALASLRDFAEEPETEGSLASDVGLLASLKESRWRGVLRVCHEGGEVYRVTYRGGEIHIAPWIDTLFGVGKRILGSEHTGIWPIDEVSFSWPRENPLLQTNIWASQGEVQFNLLVDPESQNPDRSRKLEVEYWRGGYWIGKDRLWPENPELRINLLPDWPYLLRVKGDESLVLKVTCHQVDLSPAERGIWTGPPGARTGNTQSPLDTEFLGALPARAIRPYGIRAGARGRSSGGNAGWDPRSR